MSGGDKLGVARPTLACDLISGDILVHEGEVEWIEWLVVGVVAQEDETLALLMEFDGTLRSWSGPSDTRHFVLRRQTQHKRTSSGRYE